MSERIRERQDGDYRPPIVTEPKGGPIPGPQPLPRRDAPGDSER